MLYIPSHFILNPFPPIPLQAHSGVLCEYTAIPVICWLALLLCLQYNALSIPFPILAHSSSIAIAHNVSRSNSWWIPTTWHCSWDRYRQLYRRKFWFSTYWSRKRVIYIPFAFVSDFWGTVRAIGRILEKVARTQCNFQGSFVGSLRYTWHIWFRRATPCWALFTLLDVFSWSYLLCLFSITAFLRKEREM